METLISQKWIGMLLIEIKTWPHNKLLKSSRKQKRQMRSHSYQIPKLTSTSITRDPQNRYSHLRNHLNIQYNKK